MSGEAVSTLKKAEWGSHTHYKGRKPSGEATPTLREESRVGKPHPL